MREAFGALTTRGRGFLAGGVTAIVCGMILGEHDLVRIGLLIALLPVVAAGWAARSHHRLQMTRALDTGQTEVNRPVTVRLRLTNLGRRTQALMLEDQIPYALGSRPRFLVDPIPASESVEVSYQVRSDMRGSYRVGPLRVRICDPFGMLELERSFAPVDRLVVTPQVEDLPVISLRGSWSGSGESRPRVFTTGNAADVTVREYRTGDDLRRVHWPSSAHSGQLMVRREEQPWQSRCTLLVDNRTGSHRGRGPSSSLEAAVRASASIALHLVERGYEVRLVTATGEDLVPGPGPGTPDGRRLLSALATMPDSSATALATDWVDEDMTNCLFLAVLGAVTDADHGFFSRVGRLGGPTYGVVLDVGEWANEGSSAATGWLQSIGWYATTMGPRSALRRTWQGLDR